ncbi:bifunctional 2-C-methyl-D-erythritol 4-phosphate cytidylyltransferase/2-C-methyl-D-erythritol 2,4-cyclodiphosphate synthase [Sulfurimonas autotrophica]|uniref:Bifunctional enzyme IspD/IspF n=1 Tax=Sulfurimonas autotrophica (strain ATCC BAA-671 / DSM 16294 / JCM 11897 / OK10) TaxID=563040 RepID=E0UUR8_SULAO|nr:bifunctional 2-C-methyl-D-erythritol 4-phosphate cytidylyltransferase/2-C-methyl-D-erythritol 2,4-cyclodiphosphate synthase [Sulfurimonas autotrophica]ADN09572.1 2C-methyl-D-erythritol 2,4-cyclodiphosphate synthase [Sulfurimonas autotrophica DSM 16294]
MSDLTLILLSAGSSSRFDTTVKKQWLRIQHKPLWQFVADKFEKSGLFCKIILVASQDDIAFMKNYADYDFVQGGNSRQASLKNALLHVKSEYVLVSDIARACISEELLQRILAKKGNADCIVPYLHVTDTIVYENTTIDRQKVKRIQTPQLSRTKILKNALQTSTEFTDESSAIVSYGATRAFVEGDENAYKITFIQDLNKLPCLSGPSSDILSGNGFDVHAFDDKGDMYLGGVKIDTEYGFKAHSDGDVALHSLIDALLGAAGMGDIGMLFPDNDVAYKGIDSKELLQRVVAKIYNYGFEIINVDITIAAQKPRIGAYKNKMRQTIAEILQIDKARVNVKATTTEKLGFIGREEGVGVIANANLKYFNWKMIG